MLVWTGVARAQTDEIQVYDAEIAAPGQLNLTWHNNYAFAGRSEPAFPGGIVPNHELNGVPEWGGTASRPGSKRDCIRAQLQRAPLGTDPLLGRDPSAHWLARGVPGPDRSDSRHGLHRGVGNLYSAPPVRGACNVSKKLAVALGGLRRVRSAAALPAELPADADALRGGGLRGSSHGVEFGIGKGLAPANGPGDKLMLMRDL